MKTLERAVRQIDGTVGVTVRTVSPVYETEPVGGPPQGAYLNAAVMVDTTADAHVLLDRCRLIEDELGRVRRERWGPRTIDIDILLYGDRIVRTGSLMVPHPRMAERAFVLRPLADIAFDTMHPVLHATVGDLLDRLDMSGVRLYGCIARDGDA